MAQITPNNLAFSAGGVFTTGGSVTFGFENVPGDPDAPATLKGIFTDSNQTIPATNPQPLDSDAKYQQSATGVLYGTPPFSILVRNSAGVQVAYNPSYNSNAYEVGTGPNETPLNSDLGSASLVDTGTAAGNVPLNSNLGNASQKTVGISSGQLPTSDNLNMVGATENFTSNNLNPNVFGGVAAGDLIASGSAENATTALFEFNVSLSTAPAFTQNGTFEIRSNTNFQLLASSLTISTIAGISSNKKLVLVVSSSGLPTGENLLLISETAASKITVN
jgi:hypothetical protein|tara:strand:+ start:11207 stop:12037 length:831 start_codon:yes stop_codon:yes gene_type:complete